MKRFVDLGEALEQPCFAFFDTVRSTFDAHGGSQHWEHLEELIQDLTDGWPPTRWQAERVARYKSLLPSRYGGDLP